MIQQRVAQQEMTTSFPTTTRKIHRQARKPSPFHSRTHIFWAGTLFSLFLSFCSATMTFKTLQVVALTALSMGSSCADEGTSKLMVHVSLFRACICLVELFFRQLLWSCRQTTPSGESQSGENLHKQTSYENNYD